MQRIFLTRRSQIFSFQQPDNTLLSFSKLYSNFFRACSSETPNTSNVLPRITILARLPNFSYPSMRFVIAWSEFARSSSAAHSVSERFNPNSAPRRSDQFNRSCLLCSLFSSRIESVMERANQVGLQVGNRRLDNPCYVGGSLQRPEHPLPNIGCQGCLSDPDSLSIKFAANVGQDVRQASRAAAQFLVYRRGFPLPLVVPNSHSPCGVGFFMCPGSLGQEPSQNGQKDRDILVRRANRRD